MFFFSVVPLHRFWLISCPLQARVSGDHRRSSSVLRRCSGSSPAPFTFPAWSFSSKFQIVFLSFRLIRFVAARPRRCQIRFHIVRVLHWFDADSSSSSSFLAWFFKFQIGWSRLLVAFITASAHTLPRRRSSSILRRVWIWLDGSNPLLRFLLVHAFQSWFLFSSGSTMEDAGSSLVRQIWFTSVLCFRSGQRLCS